MVLTIFEAHFPIFTPELIVVFNIISQKHVF